MSKVQAAQIGGRRVLLLDSITWVDAGDAGQVVVSGSHGGRSAGTYAVLFPLALCCLNDAGVGKDRAGIAALAMLDEHDISGVTYSHNSARIGEARDAWEHGIISHVNASAAALGFVAGLKLRAAIEQAFAARR